MTDIGTPSGVKAKTDANGLRISWRYTAYSFHLVPGFWALSLILIWMGVEESWSEPILYTCPSVVMSLVMLYYFLLWRLNERVVEVNRDTLTSRCEGSIPWPIPDQVFDLSSIKQMYIIERTVGRAQFKYYDIYVLPADGRREKLLTVRQGEWALYLEQEIERFLGIEDQVVRGEWRPTPYLWEK